MNIQQKEALIDKNTTENLFVSRNFFIRIILEEKYADNDSKPNEKDLYRSILINFFSAFVATS